MTSASFAAGRGLTFHLSRDPADVNTPADLILTNLTTGATVPGWAWTRGYAGNAVTFAFSNYPGGILPDGNYRATLPAGSANDGSGDPLASDYTFDFFVLAGDANHDRMVDVRDLGILAQHYGQSGPTIGFEDGDFNGDGVVDVSDLGILAQGYGKLLAAP